MKHTTRVQRSLRTRSRRIARRRRDGLGFDTSTAPAWHDNPRHEHGTDTLVGYSVVRTAWTEDHQGVIRTEVATILGATNYALAIDLVHAVRAAQAEAGELNTWALTDNLYRCGCRGDWVVSLGTVPVGVSR